MYLFFRCPSWECLCVCACVRVRANGAEGAVRCGILPAAPIELRNAPERLTGLGVMLVVGLDREASVRVPGFARAGLLTQNDWHDTFKPRLQARQSSSPLLAGGGFGAAAHARPSAPTAPNLCAGAGLFGAAPARQSTQKNCPFFVAIHSRK